MTIRATDLVKIYSKRTVVNRVSIEVGRGEVVGLLGPNGAGKTTTFSMIVGLERANSGKIFLDNQDITKMPMYRRGRQGIAYLPQEPSVFRKLTVRENIRSILTLRKLPQEEQEEIIGELLQEFRLEQVQHQRGSQLSGGERRRTEIARALATNPSFLLLDEPFAGVDPIAVGEIQEIIIALRQKNLGVLITDHNVRETLSITDRSYILKEGEILVSGTAETITNDPKAREYYLGDRFRL